MNLFRRSPLNFFFNYIRLYSDKSLFQETNNFETGVKHVINAAFVKKKKIWCANMVRVSFAKKKSISSTFPLYISKLCKIESYELLTDDKRLFPSMEKGCNFTSEEAEEIVTHYGNKLINCLISMEDKYWFLVTSLDIFIHNNKNIDDCADSSKIGYQHSSIAYIRRKGRFGLEYFELSIKIGHVEFLSTGGFWGKLESSIIDWKVNPFLGSSIPNLPDELTESATSSTSKDIYIIKSELREHLPERSNRSINQFLKEHSLNLWGFHNKPFFEKGFYPTTALNIQSTNIYFEAESLLLKIYADKKMRLKEVKKYLQLIEKDAKSTKTANLKAIKTLLKFTKQRFGHSKTINLNNQEKITKKKELIDIFNSVLYNGIKSINTAKVKKATEEYTPKKLNIFEDDD